jgi:hypothetical protein
MSEELLAKILKTVEENQAAGNKWTVIVLLALIITSMSAVWVVWLQRQVMKKYDLIEAQIKAIDPQIKAADSLRLESRSSQDQGQKLIMDQLNAVIQRGEFLQKEIERLEKKQDGLKQSVKNAIDVGLEDIKLRLTNISVSEFLNEIPPKFRSDLETEITTASNRVAQDFIQKVRELPEIKVDDKVVKSVTDRMEKVVRDVVGNYEPYRFERGMAYHLAEVVVEQMHRHGCCRHHW